MESIENLQKQPINILVCFTDPEIGKTLSRLATYYAISKSDKSTVTFLYLNNKEHYTEPAQLEEFINIMDKNKITIRYFVKKYDDYPSEIIKTSKEQNSNLILIGVSNNELNPTKLQKYNRLKSNPTNSEANFLEQFSKEELQLFRDVSSLFDMNPIPAGLFIYNDLKSVDNVFISILSTADVQAFPFLTFRFAQKENVELMIWDAIGAFETNPKLQKINQSYIKKAEEKVYLWNNDKKIDKDFILEQDLCIFGMDGWNKLINTSLPWIEALPSTLILKDKTI